MRKRKWIYVGHPVQYEIRCDKCKGINIAWSEFEHKIWCYDCKIDTSGTGGIFDGPIPMGCAELLGCSFKRYYLKSRRIMKLTKCKKSNRLVYRQCSKKEASIYLKEEK